MDRFYKILIINILNNIIIYNNIIYFYSIVSFSVTFAVDGQKRPYVALLRVALLRMWELGVRN